MKTFQPLQIVCISYNYRHSSKGVVVWQTLLYIPIERKTFALVVCYMCCSEVYFIYCSVDEMVSLLKKRGTQDDHTKVKTTYFIWYMHVTGGIVAVDLQLCYIYQ